MDLARTVAGLGRVALALWALAACDDAEPRIERPDALDASAPVDRAPPDDPDGALDATVDGAADAAPDGEPDAGSAPPTCRIEASPRPAEALRVAGCRLVRGGEAAVVPRVVVVSGDSLSRAAATPLHAPEHWAGLRAAGVDVVWLIALWEGIEPMPGTYNGAYTARLCQSAREAGEAGLEVVLAMAQQRFGPAVGGHGMPRWATPAGLAAVPEGAGPDHPSLDAAWQGFWGAEGGAGPEGLVAAWTRLLDACVQAEVPRLVGVAALESPLGRVADGPRFDALSDAVEAAAEARFGPLLRFEYGLWVDGALVWSARPGPDRARVVPGWGPAGWPGARPPADALWRAAAVRSADRAQRPLWFVGAGGDSVEAMTRDLDAVEAVGRVAAVWQDGFGTPHGLRDADGRPAALWAPALARPRPASLAGRPLSWQTADGSLTLRWWADGSDQGLSRIDLAGRVPGEVGLEPADAFEWFADHDPSTGLLAVYVDGAVGEVALVVALDGVE